MTDVIICEDEPYFCLFTGPWTSRHDKSEKSILAQRQADAESKEGPEGRDAFINALPPTYLRYDTQGRVIRLDVSIPVLIKLTFRHSPKHPALVHVLAGSPRRPSSSSDLPERPKLLPKHQAVS